MTCRFYTEDERDFLNGLRSVVTVSNTLPREDFERLEELLGRVPVYDREIGWHNQNMLFIDLSDARWNLRFRGIKVYSA